jgi:hypothetical protein
LARRPSRNLRSACPCRDLLAHTSTATSPTRICGRLRSPRHTVVPQNSGVTGSVRDRVEAVKPLGEYEHFLQGDALSWSAGTVTHGSRVLDDLVTGIEHHRETATAGYWRRLGATSAALSCVPWLMDFRVVNALASLGEGCIIVDKQQPDYSAARHLAEIGRPLSSLFLDGFDMLTRPGPDGSAPVLGPYSPRVEPVELGPVRMVGWSRDAQGTARPMLHSKMLVLGVTTYWENDEDFTGDVARFEPKITWMGSANWTNNARQHIEHGMWSTDPALVRHNYKYLLDLLSFSEPRGVTTVGPEPELVSAVFDDQAFFDYLRAYPDEGDPDPEPDDHF